MSFFFNKMGKSLFKKNGNGNDNVLHLIQGLAYSGVGIYQNSGSIFKFVHFSVCKF